MTVVELLGLDRGEVVDRAVGAFVVEPVHPFQGRDLDVVPAAPRALRVDQLGLVQTDLRLGRLDFIGNVWSKTLDAAGVLEKNKWLSLFREKLAKEQTRLEGVRRLI